MEIGILATHQNHEIERLLETAETRGHNARLLNVFDFGINICLDQPSIYYKGKPVHDDFDAIIPRIDIPYTNLGYKLLRQFQAMGTFVTDTAYSLELARDKLRCLQYLLKKEVPFPATGFAYAKKGYDELIKVIGEPPFVIKLNEGTQGIGVFLAEDEKNARNLLKTFAQLDTEVMLQEFIEESSGTDLRCFVVGGKVVASMRREAQDGDFRANISLGGHAHDADLSPEEEELAIKASAAVGMNISGVDIIRSNRGPLVIEINSAPDFTGKWGLENISGVDVAAAIIAHTEEYKKLYDQGEGVWLEDNDNSIYTIQKHQ